MFAKLYETPTNQILVLRDTDDQGNPCVSFTTEVGDLGRAKLCISFDDTDEGHEEANEAFANTTEDSARQVLEEALDILNQG